MPRCVCGKINYPDEATALAKLATLRARGRTERNAYQCPHSAAGAWHLTSKPPRPPARSVDAIAHEQAGHLAFDSAVLDDV